jgi:hypothetical protein
MTHHTNETPWIPANAGDLITSDNWNDVQRYARADIKQSATDLEGKIDDVSQGLQNVDAVKFGGKTPDEWAEQFAPRIHDHEGQSVYRRYIKEFTQEVNKAFLMHKLGRFPIVDVYQLLNVVNVNPDNLPANEKGRYTDCKLLLYTSHTDIDRLNLMVSVYRDRVPLGLPFEQILGELEVQYDGNTSIADVVNDMWNAFRLDPNDEIKHCTTPWIDDCCERERTVDDLKRSGEWDDIYLAFAPVKCASCGQFASPDNNPLRFNVDIAQVNYDTLLIDAPNLVQNQVLDLMFLLRI